MQLSEINNQRISTLNCDNLICQNCGVVDRQHRRMQHGFPCPSCGNPSDRGRLLFSINFHILVDLTQEAFHSTSPIASLAGPQSSSVASLVRLRILASCGTASALATPLLNKTCQRPASKYFSVQLFVIYEKSDKLCMRQF